MCVQPMAAPYMGAVPMVSNPTPLYFILLLGLTFFIWQTTLSGMLPGANKAEAWTPLVLQAAFAVLMLTVCANMLGNIRGVSPLELTWVHLTAGILIFFIMWNYHLANQPKPEEKRSSSSSSSSSSAKLPEAPASKPKETPKEPDPWENELAHPSAFLTTSKVEPKPWPFPLGLADKKDKLKLWWESGLPAHVGHFNRPQPPLPAKEKSSDKSKDKEHTKESKPKPEEPQSTEPKKAVKEKSEPAKMTPEQEMEERKKRKEAEAKKMKELEIAKIQELARAKKKFLQGKATKRLWRTRVLCIVVGISMINKPTAFFMLLAFAMNMVSDWLNPTPISPDPPKPTSSSAERSSEKRSADSTSRSRDELRDARERPRESRDAADASSASSRPKKGITAESHERQSETPSSSADLQRPSDGSQDRREATSRSALTREPGPSRSSSSRDPPDEPKRSSSSRDVKDGGSRESTPSSREAREPSEKSSSSQDVQAGSSRASSSSTLKSEVVTSDAIKKAAGSTTITKPSEKDIGQPKIGFGMHYIHVTDGANLLDPALIPSRGMAHPLMTTLAPGLAN